MPPLFVAFSKWMCAWVAGDSRSAVREPVADLLSRPIHEGAELARPGGREGRDLLVAGQRLLDLVVTGGQRRGPDRQGAHHRGGDRELNASIPHRAPPARDWWEGVRAGRVSGSISGSATRLDIDFTIYKALNGLAYRHDGLEDTLRVFALYSQYAFLVLLGLLFFLRRMAVGQRSSRGSCGGLQRPAGARDRSAGGRSREPASVPT